MILIFQIFFWASLVLLLHSYLIYPFILKLLAKGKSDNSVVYENQNLPHVAIVMAAFNEEKVIAEKLESILKLNYPNSKLKLFIGSDNSTDATNQICQNYAQNHDFISFVNYKRRSGKAGVLNQLMKNEINPSEFEVLIMTDANVIFEPECVFHLVKHFKNTDIGLVAANVINTEAKSNEIAVQEKMYISQENELKYREGLVLGSAMGAFGACYAIRAVLMKEIPGNFLMEDFYLSMEVMSKHKKSITEPLALAYEDLPGSVDEEFKRKRRISAGNFQNLKAYKKLLISRPFSLAFAFFSHKVIRWFGPFLLFTAFTMLAFLSVEAPAYKLYQVLFVISNLILLSALFDYALMYLNIHVNLLRLLRYFLLMNFALFLGFVDYINGVKTNIWKPTERNE
jgi:cellulose synthase/poly-beta-1,6-N-acetylglucosamine synthase-like glycosyltransferase